MATNTASMTVCKTSWAAVVKGPTQKKKFNAASLEFVPRKKAEQKFKFNAEASEFVLPEPLMNASAPEFVPPVRSLNANVTTTQPVPPQHKLLHKASEMQKILLECFTDNESSDSDEDEPHSTMQMRKPPTRNSNIAVRPFRPPPGLAPPDVGLNPLAAAFEPPTCLANGPKMHSAPACTSVVNFAGFYSEDEDDESPVSTPRDYSKMDKNSVHDSTSAGESSDSETESWSGPYSP
jgi:hypothetical protein